MEKVESDSVDYIVSIYSPISFIYEKREAFSEMYRVLKKGGKIIIMGHGLHNAISSKINNFCAESAELERLSEDKMVKWGEHVPELNVFSKEILEGDLKNAGFYPDKTYGVPVFAQSGPEDFDPENIKKSRISSALDKQEFFDKVFEIEMKYNSDAMIVNRGMNIFSVGIKK